MQQHHFFQLAGSQGTWSAARKWYVALQYFSCQMRKEYSKIVRIYNDCIWKDGCTQGILGHVYQYLSVQSPVNIKVILSFWGKSISASYRVCIYTLFKRKSGTSWRNAASVQSLTDSTAAVHYNQNASDDTNSENLLKKTPQQSYHTIE